MSFPRYPAYKDSGVAWLAKIPSHWAVVQLRHLVDCLDGQRIPLNSAERSDRKGDIPYWGANNVQDYIDAHLFDEELVLLGEDGAPFFDKTKPVAFRSEGRIWPNNHIHVLRPRTKGESAYLTYCLNATDFADYVDGSTRDKLTQSAMNRIAIPQPSNEERGAIVHFLDRETAKIDALVAEQEQLITLLKEKRQAVISHAVTKGLDSSLPMKDSGVEWLGQVPEHWTVVRLGVLFDDVDERGTDDLPVLSVSIHHGVSDSELDESELDRKVTRSDDRSKYKKVMPGDLVYNMMRAWQGGFGTVEVEGMVSPAYVVARPKSDTPTLFVEQLLRTATAVEEMRRHSRGVTDFRLRLYWEEFKSLVIAVPPSIEAARLCEHIASEVRRFDSVVLTAEQLIAQLIERRSALISAAVTGQIDVRGLAPAPEQAA